jgi:ATP-dependent RNA helicase DDX41
MSWIPLKKRRALEAERRAQKRQRLRSGEQLHDDKDEESDEQRMAAFLVEQSVEKDRLKEEQREMTLYEERALIEAKQKELGEEAARIERVAAEERDILAQLENIKDLKTVEERALGVRYTSRMPSTWRPPRLLDNVTDDVMNALREHHLIDVDGLDIPPLAERFEDLRLPEALTRHLVVDMRIRKPTPIQMQGLPVALSGRDMIGVAFTGSGKTLVFAMPLLCVAIEQSARLPLIRGEGPLALILAPSRELARQTYNVIEQFSLAMSSSSSHSSSSSTSQMSGRYFVERQRPNNNSRENRIQTMLCIGGIDMRDQLAKLRDGVHAVVATPGRLLSLLRARKMSLASCVYFALDEADRLIDMGFEDDIRQIMDFFSAQRQTLLFSATMPRTIQLFARSALVDPIVVNVGRAGAASLDVVQDVELVDDSDRLAAILRCLQKTRPPVIIFAEATASVDDIHEFLLLKGVNAGSVHGRRLQEDREAAIDKFRSGAVDVLVATDVASKGLDFDKIAHVINFEMPDRIEDYVHRIGRTGRGGRTGVATTFISPQLSATVLLDLKHLLTEAKQRVPPFLDALKGTELATMKINGIVGCAFCGGGGHRIVHCDKLVQLQRRNASLSASSSSSTASSSSRY